MILGEKNIKAIQQNKNLKQLNKDQKDMLMKGL